MREIERRWRRWLLLGILGMPAWAGWADVPLQWRGNRGWEPKSAYCRLYDTHYVVTIQGTVERVEKVIPLKGMGYGAYFVLKTQAERIPVHLGPTWFVESQPLQFRSPDPVEVTGSRVWCDGKPVLQAAIVRKGTEKVLFRELSGRPLWTGR